jgi:hypothetical protein
VLVRKLSPNDYKVEAKPKAKSEEQESHKAVAVSVLVNPKMLHAMGRDLAAIHRGTPRRRQAIVDDLDVRPRDWLLKAVKAAEESIKVEWAGGATTTTPSKEAEEGQVRVSKDNPQPCGTRMLIRPIKNLRCCAGRGCANLRGSKGERPCPAQPLPRSAAPSANCTNPDAG